MQFQINMKNLNREKRLIKLKDVPKHFATDEIAYEIKKIMKYESSESKDFGGIFLEEDSINNPHVKYYIFFLSKNSISKLLELCHVINEKKFIYMFNHAIEVQYVQNEIWTLMTAEHINDKLSENEIVIRHSTFTNIVSLFHLLPEHMRIATKHHQIYSIIQNTTSTFIRFNSNTNAIRATKMYEREGLEVEWSKTYVCLCKEFPDDHPIPKESNPKRKIQSQNNISTKASRIKFKPSREDPIPKEIEEKGKNILITFNNRDKSPQTQRKKDVSLRKRSQQPVATEFNGNKKISSEVEKTSKKIDDILILTDQVQFSDDD